MRFRLLVVVIQIAQISGAIVKTSPGDSIYNATKTSLDEVYNTQKDKITVAIPQILSYLMQTQDFISTSMTTGQYKVDQYFTMFQAQMDALKSEWQDLDNLTFCTDSETQFTTLATNLKIDVLSCLNSRGNEAATAISTLAELVDKTLDLVNQLYPQLDNCTKIVDVDTQEFCIELVAMTVGDYELLDSDVDDLVAQAQAAATNWTPVLTNCYEQKVVEMNYKGSEILEDIYLCIINLNILD